MSAPAPLVFVVDDEPLVSASLARLIRSLGLRVQTFATAQEFLRAERPDVPGCLVLDVRLPDVSGLDLQAKLAEAGVHLPVIFLTGHGDIPMSVRAMKAGALEFLTKPCKDQDLLEAIQRALERDRIAWQRRAEVAGLRARYAALTPREREVLPLVVRGLLNKQIAAELGTSEKTIKIHRGRIIQKMKAESLPDLVRMAQALDLPSATSSPRRPIVP
jgi:FixJ family two-component response regulator